MAGARGGAALDGAVPPVPASHAETRAVLTLAVQRAPDTRTRGYNVLIIIVLRLCCLPGVTLLVLALAAAPARVTNTSAKWRVLLSSLTQRRNVAQFTAAAHLMF